MRQQRLLSRLPALARQWLGQEASTSAASSSGGGYCYCPVLQQQRAALQRRWAHTTRLLAAEAEGGTRATARDVAPVSMRTLILMLMAGAGVTYATRMYTDQKMQKVVASSQQVAGQAAVGGPFELIDQDGKPFTDKDLLGEFALLYFGFTHCPDICPDEMEKVAESINMIEKWTGVRVTPVFISVDPQRDKPALVKSYVSEFHPRMIGLTGDLDNVKAVSKSYRVYYSKTGESETDYLVDHSIIHYLINPAGDFVTFFGKSTDAQQLATQVLQHIADWQKEHPKYHPGAVLKPPAAAPAAAAAAAK
ncbi:Protein SCO1 1, mitochondrial [Tetrabaena socialis]|uniref:Protein SCO1 1, mitochondrial n=1 Tax=Tetrabaena socialis TaxID=47790 RepID=A0A2J7ZTP5_9CHLO|nr:Protein SCO1 1, mitochondrial [Tetrabaena socialis]|eukprot:PNH03651.1 Protein SCO1 1, mitochondrial [Tetrabaena socialis]